MKIEKICALVISMWAISVFSFFAAANAHAEERIHLWKSQTVYVPIYSHIFVGGNEKIPLNLAVNLVIRNTDSKNAITIRAIKYYNSEGAVLKDFISGLETCVCPYFIYGWALA